MLQNITSSFQKSKRKKKKYIAPNQNNGKSSSYYKQKTSIPSAKFAKEGGNLTTF